ncbi:VCBS domain-containing protein [Loktanella sp. F6476L]|uniref:VCBS domain-containing protein n=1 Tax=Loktanella sp. F6476L TaxID=2926405 RepID=UPI001FF541D0|nr:VCBS domain-containing protein [Loktanella sp. F6476L]MCK0119715.1 VCBS domain-containing protein [Loktanella sp. F6476L]
MSGCTAPATSMSFTLEGQVNVSITITEVDGNLQFDLQVLDDTGEIGDLNAIYFDLFDDSLTGGLSVTGDDVTGTAFKVDGVTKVDNFTNMNGEVVKDYGKFDGGVQFGTQGMSTDDIRSTSFTLSHETVDLTLADFNLQDFGARLTSVGTEDGAREDSLKLGGTAPEVPEGPTEPTEAAVDDTMTVLETAGFGRGDTFDFLDSGEASILANDLGDCDDPYTGSVVSMNGTTIDPMSTQSTPTIIAGDNGGMLQITADGAINFSADSVDGTNTFAALNDGESAVTNFVYTLEGGSTATLEVTVNGIGTDGGGGGGGETDAFMM